MFSNKGRLTRQTSIKTIMNTRMLKRTPIINHMIGMIRLFNKMGILGDKINGKIKANMVDMVLEAVELLQTIQA